MYIHIFGVGLIKEYIYINGKDRQEDKTRKTQIIPKTHTHADNYMR